MSDAAPTVASRPRRTRRALLGALGVGVTAAALIGVLATRSVTPQATVSTALMGHVAPAINGRSITGTEHVSLSSLRGRYVVLVFFASWCAPCTDEVPQLESFMFAHRKSDSASVVGIDIDDSTDDGLAFMRRTGATWPAIEDANGLIAQHYGVDEPPQAFLINPNGRVVARVLSGVTAKVLDSLIATAQQSSGGSAGGT